MVNKVFLIGRLGQDPVLKYTNKGDAVCDLSIATGEKFKGKDGVLKETTTWHRIVVWKKQAESCDKYLSKGSQVCVEGKIQTRDYEDKQGIKRYVTEILASNITFLGGAGQESSAISNTGPGIPDWSASEIVKPKNMSATEVQDTFTADDIPF